METDPTSIQEISGFTLVRYSLIQLQKHCLPLKMTWMYKTGYESLVGWQSEERKRKRKRESQQINKSTLG